MTKIGIFAGIRVMWEWKMGICGAGRRVDGRFSSLNLQSKNSSQPPIQEFLSTSNPIQKIEWLFISMNPTDMNNLNS